MTGLPLSDQTFGSPSKIWLDQHNLTGQEISDQMLVAWVQSPVSVHKNCQTKSLDSVKLLLTYSFKPQVLQQKGLCFTIIIVTEKTNELILL